MVYYGVIWSYCRLVFTCFPLSSFCFLSCFHAFPVTVSVGFLSAFVSFCWSRFFFPTLFFLLLHLHFVKFLLSACKYSFHPEVSFSRLVLRSGTKPKRGKNECKIHDKQLGMNLARSWQTFFPILLLLRQLPLPLRGLVVLLLQAFVLPAPTKHQQRQHHRDCCCCSCCWCCWCWCW